MKRIMTTALALTLLCGTSALAQERERRGPADRAPRGEGDRRPQSRPEPQAQPQAPQPQVEQAQPAPRPQVQARPQGHLPAVRPSAGPQSARPENAPRPERPAFQQRPQVQPARPQGPLPGVRPDDRGSRQGDDVRGPGRDSRPDTPRDNRNDGRYDNRDGRNDWNGRNDRDGRNPGWNGPGGPQTRPPVIRPQDRWDRDRGRPSYDQRRYPHYVTPRYRYQWRGPVYRPPIGFYVSRWQFGQTLPWSWYTPNYYLNDWWSYGLPTPPAGYEWVRVGDDAVMVNIFNGRIYQVVYNLFW